MTDINEIDSDISLVGLLGIDIIANDNRVTPLIIMGMIISLLGLLKEYAHNDLSFKPIYKTIIIFMWALVSGALVMNVVFFGVLYLQGDIPSVLAGGIAGLVSARSEKVLNKVSSVVDYFRIGGTK